MDKSEASETTTLTSHSDSTKTDSSGAESVVTQKEEDFTKDNGAAPIDLECHIQAERITKILNEAITKTKIALTLPQLMRERTTLATSLSPQHLEEIEFIFEQYEHPLFTVSLMNMAAIEDLDAGDMSLKNRLNPELGHLIYVLDSYPAIKPKVEELVNEMRRENLADYLNKEAPMGLLYLLLLEQFRDQIRVQMDLTAAEELKVKYRTRKLEQSNEKLLAKIKEYTLALKDETDVFDNTMEIKQSIIVQLEQELELYEKYATFKLKKQILDSERQMVVLSRAHAIKGEILREESMDTQNGYELTLRNNLKAEKNQRARRIKVETQLLSWVQKYDTEMRDKQVELDEFIQLYDEEKKMCEELEVKLEEQDKEYLPLMKEREEEYHQEMTEKMAQFQVEHAARVIQYAWRTTVANRAEKKKLKKLLKKMQEKREAEERMAEIQARKAAAAAKKAEKEAKQAEKEAKKAERAAQIQAKKEEAAAAAEKNEKKG